MSKQINLLELEKAVKLLIAKTDRDRAYVEANDTCVILTSFDRQSDEIKVTLYRDGTMLPKVSHTSRLE